MSNMKRSNHNYSSSDSYKRHQSSNNQRETQTNTSSSDIPGFYYDEEKKKYFKIQPNHQRQTNCVTNDLIKTKNRENDLTKSLKIIKPTNLIKNIFLNFELGISRDLYNVRDNYIVSNLKRKSIIELNIRNNIKRTCMLQLDANSDHVYLLLDCQKSINFLKVYKTIDKFCKNTELQVLDSDTNITDFDFDLKLLNIQDNRYCIKTVEETNSYTTYVSELTKNHNGKISGDGIFNHVFFSENEIWCNRLNSTLGKTFSKLSYGLDKNSMILTCNERRSITHVNTLKSGVFCQKFHPIVSFY
jgi:hypothetical protein